MLIDVKKESRRIVNLVRAVRMIREIMPGDTVTLLEEKPATYLGPLEEGDMQTDYIQLHLFRLHDGTKVVLEAPSLNRRLSKYLY